MKFDEVAALYIHDVKNDLMRLATHAAERGERETEAVAVRAGETLAKLLTLYRAGSVGVHPNIDAACPADLVDEVARLHAGVGAVAIDTDSTGAPAFAFYDESLLRFALNNAVQNALRSARARIHVEAARAGEYLEFRVDDDGAGFPEAVLDAACSLGEGEVRPLAKAQGAGSGLGLALSQAIASAHRREAKRGYLKLWNDNGARFALGVPV